MRLRPQKCALVLRWGVMVLLVGFVSGEPIHGYVTGTDITTTTSASSTSQATSQAASSSSSSPASVTSSSTSPPPSSSTLISTQTTSSEVLSSSSYTSSQPTSSSSSVIPSSAATTTTTTSAVSSTSSATPRQVTTSTSSISNNTSTTPKTSTSTASGLRRRELHSPDKLEAPTKRPSRPKVCQISNGESVAIVEINESQNSDMRQLTVPRELPISGDVEAGEIELKIESETHKYFKFEDNSKQLRLTRPLDRDAVYNGTSQIHAAMSYIYLQVSCFDRRPPETSVSDDTSGVGHSASSARSKVIVPVLVKVIDINDNSPKFGQDMITVQVSELSPVNSIVVSAEQLRAIDADSGANGQIEYSLDVAPVGRPSSRIVTQLDSSVVSSPHPTSSLPLSSTSSSTTSSSATGSDDLATSSTTEPDKPTLNRELASTRLPSINMSSEPIANGPMDDSDEESDEALLASINGTLSTEPTEPPEPPEIGEEAANLHPSRLLAAHNLRLRFRRQTSDATASSTSRYSEQSSEHSSELQHFRSAGGRVLWTNLMASPSVESQTLSVLGASSTNGNQNQHPRHKTNPTGALVTKSSSSSDFFYLDLAPNSNVPVIKLNRQLDFETQQVHYLTLWATDLAPNKSTRHVSSIQIVVRVVDGDDQPPAFVLDQAGCATGSVPQFQAPTTAASLSLDPMDSFDTSADRKPKPQPFGSTSNSNRNPPSNSFKITEFADDFDFSESLVVTSRPALDPYTCLGGPIASGPNQTEYFASVTAGEFTVINAELGVAGGQLPVRVAPQSIKARDRDSFNSPIKYSFVNGTPANYSQFFHISPLEGLVTQLAPIDKTNYPEKFVMWVEAQELSAKRLASYAKLTIYVNPADYIIPQLSVNSYSGFIDENSQPGTKVSLKPSTSSNSTSISITASTSSWLRIELVDLNEPPQRFEYELDTSNELFKVDKTGHLFVNKLTTSDSSFFDADANLDGQPRVHQIQISARQLSSPRAPMGLTRKRVSPITLNVTLVDVNDNPPELATDSLGPLELVASSNRADKRLVVTLKATDRDKSVKTKCKFMLISVNGLIGGTGSNSSSLSSSTPSKDRFSLDELSGELRANGKFVAGESFNLTVQLVDVDGLKGPQSSLELKIVPKPNLGPPMFVTQSDFNMVPSSPGSTGSGLGELQPRPMMGDYSAEVVEAMAPNSPILQVHARDPDGDLVSYSLVAGNLNNDFHLDSKTGMLYLHNKLDREDVSQYHLVVQARDASNLTSTRNIKLFVTDTNDENPVFSQSQYEFSVLEDAKVGSNVGRVYAIDSDSGENGRLSYSIERAPLAIGNPKDNTGVASSNAFAINEQTGDIQLLEKLDYETQQVHTIVVTAKDHDKNPRSTNVLVQIRVLDIQDEDPYFEPANQLIQVRVNEDSPAGFVVAKAIATDPDSSGQSITFELKAGNASLFAVDAHTGQVKLLQQLDYEHQTNFSLVVGTSERQLMNVSTELRLIGKTPKLAVCRVDIQVLDSNDNSPQFDPTRLVPTRVAASSPLGAQVAHVLAHDSDATEPNNLVRYELASSDSISYNQASGATSGCASYFMIEPSSGVVSVKSDLRRMTESECQLAVRARDLGREPSSLSSVAILPITIDHIAEIHSLNSMLAFADSQFTVEVDENCAPNSLIKLLPVINKPNKFHQQGKPMSLYTTVRCEIVHGNELGKFYVMENQDRDCELRLRKGQSIDYEDKQRYSLTVRLTTGNGQSGSTATTLAASLSLSTSGSTSDKSANLLSHNQRLQVCQVNVHVVDKNDNAPKFSPVPRYDHLTGGKYIATVASDAPADTQVIQLRAQDGDHSYANGHISYELLNSEELEHRFKVDSTDGIVRTSKPIDDIPSHRLPLRLRIQARDHPEVASDSLEATAEIFVNLIDDRHRIALVFEQTPSTKLVEIKDQLLSIIQERSGLISGLDKMESAKIKHNSSLVIEPDVNSTDFWFYLVEPGTLRLIPSHNSRVQAALFEAHSQASLLDTIEQTLGYRNVNIRLPYVGGSSNQQVASGGRFGSQLLFAGTMWQDNDRMGSMLIYVSIGMALVGFVALVCQCGSGAGSGSREASRANARFLEDLPFAADPATAKQLLQQAQSGSQVASYFLANAMNQRGLMADAAGQFGSLQAPSNGLFHPLDPSSMQHQTLNSSSSNSNPTASLCHNLAHHGSNSINNTANHNHSHNTANLNASQKKEYETQMLKMSCLFDDTHSVDVKAHSIINDNRSASKKTNHLDMN